MVEWLNSRTVEKWNHFEGKAYYKIIMAEVKRNLMELLRRGTSKDQQCVDYENKEEKWES
ncbi:hypothetical protein [Clostridium intestinale]|uniref:Uncharacterized protein n=1 Tax=Clostridium intestinale TaxID=36845 RepID=A0A7D6VUD5_9CLOT|nr:hypothetical protein [Clostridium intestinale]QLY79332.1 hypothetical protein HZF06_20165 [Clostridium intestinale]